MNALDVLTRAREAIMPHLHRTPLHRSTTLSEIMGCQVYLKQELFQKTGSYKPRGMLWALEELGPGARERGVITFSAGNAAQGLAFAARLSGTRALVVMPETASPAKAEATRGYGAEVILHGTSQACRALCADLVQRQGLSFISSYDDRDLMIGHASMGLEILEDLPEAAAIFAGIGGGGMAGGLVLAAEALGHGVRLVGVEPEGAPAMSRSLAAGKAVSLDHVQTIADGLAAPSAGEHCYALVSRRFEQVVLVKDAQIAAAVKLLMARCKLFAEPAGAAALAGLLSQSGRFAPDHHVVCVVSGGNLDFGRLAEIL